MGRCQDHARPPLALQTLQKKFASKEDFATKQKKAEANRAAFNGAVAAKAAEENDKVMNAQSRKAVAEGAEGQIFSVSAATESTETTTGWGAAKAMPARLSQRLQSLQKKFASKEDFASKQKKAEATVRRSTMPSRPRLPRRTTRS